MLASRLRAALATSKRGFATRTAELAKDGRGTRAALVIGASATLGLVGYKLTSPVSLDAPARITPVTVPVGTSLGKLPSQQPLISYEDVQRHNSRNDCWVVIAGQVYDVTGLIDSHPGGAAAILRHGGKDATKVFAPLHSPDALSTLPPSALIGPIDPSTVPRLAIQPTAEELRIQKAREELPVPTAAINLRDVETLAKNVMSSTAWAYYSSAGDDEYSNRENSAAFRRFWFRPRVLHKVSKISTSTTIFNAPSSLPIFVAPAALARLGHPGGEVNIVRAAAEDGIVQGISINASCSLDEITAARAPGQPLIFQLYMNRARQLSEQLIKRVENDGFVAIMLTVDSAVPGKRERDQRTKASFTGPAGSQGDANASKGVAHAISGYQDPDVCWDDIPWLRRRTKLPLVIKGIQCVEDAEKAFESGVQGIVISNHGGRSLDFSPAPMTVLHELHLRRPDLLHRSDFQVYLDGGVRRGTDVLKALCLGARAVGIGRPYLYGNAAWGEEGVRRVTQIMREEIETGMRLLGVTSIDQLTPEMVRYVDRDPVPFRRDD